MELQRRYRCHVEVLKVRVVSIGASGGCERLGRVWGESKRRKRVWRDRAMEEEEEEEALESIIRGGCTERARRSGREKEDDIEQ